MPKIDDGETSVTLDISTLAPGDRIAFTVDVDDQLSNSELGQIRVAGGEIAGATLSYGTATASFSKNNIAALNVSTCNAQS